MSDLTAERIAAALSTQRLGHEVEHYPVAVTTGALALGWLRARGGSHGSLVVADREISARSRSGDDWASADGLSASVVLEPDLAADQQDLLWAHALVATSRAYESAGVDVVAEWPELIRAGGQPVGLVAIETQLGPGRVKSAVATFRLDVPSAVPSDTDRLGLLAALLAELEVQLEHDAGEVVATYHALCGFLGRIVEATLLPRGVSRGTAASIDERGAFGVTRASGRVTRMPVDQIRSIEVV